MKPGQVEIKVTFHDKVLFEGVVESTALSCDATCVKVEFRNCVEIPEGEMGGEKFSPNQIRQILLRLPSSERVSWLYYMSPSDWSFTDVRKCLTYNEIDFIENN